MNDRVVRRHDRRCLHTSRAGALFRRAAAPAGRASISICANLLFATDELAMQARRGAILKALERARATARRHTACTRAAFSRFAL